MQQFKKLKCLNSFELKLIAMALMLCDHLWATVIAGNQWLTCIGRIAFPIFAFQIAEGFRHTHDTGKYLKRLFLFALVSEFPFNLMTGGSLFYPFQQNVLFTFCIAVIMMRLIEKSRSKKFLIFVLSAAGCSLLGLIIGSAVFSDYGGFGVLTVLLFYFFHDQPFAWAAQLAGMLLIHWHFLGSFTINFELAGHLIEFPQQAFAVLALIPIWLYSGRQGPHSKPVQYSFYVFYPLHMLILSLAALIGG